MDADYPVDGYFSVVLFNTEHGRVTRSAEMRDECKKEMLQIIRSKCSKPLFILCQELDDKKKLMFWENLLTEDHYPGRVVFDNSEAGYAYVLDSPPTQYRITPLDSSRLTSAAAVLQHELGNEFEDFIIKRQSACVLRLNNVGGKSILLVSWHGPQNEHRGKKTAALTDVKKRNIFNTLIRLFELLRGIQAYDVVLIGGDFNLPFHTLTGKNKVKEPDTRLHSIITVDNTQARVIGLTVGDRQKFDMDYIVYWPVDGFGDTCQLLDMRPDHMKNTPKPFDHPVLMYNLQFRLHPRAVSEVLMEWFKSRLRLLQEQQPTFSLQLRESTTMGLCFNSTSQPTENEERFEIRGSCLPKVVGKYTAGKEKEITVFQYVGARPSGIPKQFEEMKELSVRGLKMDGHVISVEWYLSSKWRPPPALQGISGANTKLFCLWCHCVTDVGDVMADTDFPYDGDPQKQLPWVGFNPPVRTECLLQERISRILFRMVVRQCRSRQKEGALTKRLGELGLTLDQLGRNVIDPMLVSAKDLKLIIENLNVRKMFDREQPGTSVAALTEPFKDLTVQGAGSGASQSAVPQQPPEESEEMQWAGNMQELWTGFGNLMKELHSSDTTSVTHDAFTNKAKALADLFRQSAAADTDVTLYSGCLWKHAPCAYEIRRL